MFRIIQPNTWYADPHGAPCKILRATHEVIHYIRHGRTCIASMGRFTIRTADQSTGRADRRRNRNSRTPEEAARPARGGDAMRIEELPKLPKLFRVIEVDLDVLRNGIGSGWGVIFDQTP
jgi:hypothetical protein